jgi:hypothetical protein
VNLEALKLFQSLLAAVGLDLAAVEDWVKGYEAEHPDASGLLDAFVAWIAPKLESAGLTQLANAALSDLKVALATGKGPISKQTAPTDFA